MHATKIFEQWGLGFSGCDGGDLGSPTNRSVRVCGIEWGGGHDLEGLRRHMHEDMAAVPAGYSCWKENISYIFNWQVMKLLTALAGENVSDYKKFAETAKPFIEGNYGYFKMNLYPIAFRNTASSNWKSEFSEITGLPSKSEYLTWCKEFRLPQIRQWAQENKPEIIICLGKTYIDDFMAAFASPDDEFITETFDGREISWAVNADGTLVVVLPFMVNRNGLVRNVTIQKVGDHIKQLRHWLTEAGHGERSRQNSNFQVDSTA